LSFVHPFGDPRTEAGLGTELLTGAEIPASLKEMVRQKCGNCHSESVDWPVYSHVAPVSWLVERDVTLAREHMNLSRWRAYRSEKKEELLTKFAAEVRSGEMPPSRYTAIHRDAVLRPPERELLYEWARLERKRLKPNQQVTER